MQMPITPFADPQQPHLTAGPVLARHQPQGRGKLPPGGELAPITDRSRRGIARGKRLSVILVHTVLGFMEQNTHTFRKRKENWSKTMAKKFRDLRYAMSPEAQARAHEKAKAMKAELPLAGLRQACYFSQEQFAAELQVK